MSQRNLKYLYNLVFIVAFFSTNSPYVYAELGIDPSWWSSLVMAIDKGYTFGEDFIFNYGPLGYFNTLLLPPQVSPWVIFVFHVFLVVNFLFIAHYAFRRLGQQWWKAALVSIVILLPWGFIADATFTLFLLLIFWLLYVKETRLTTPLLVVVLLAVLIFFIKVNLSAIVYFLLLGSLVYFAFSRAITWRTVGIISALLIVLTWAFAQVLNVSLVSYVSSSFQIIDAYQDAMAVRLVDGKELYIMLAFFFIILTGVLLLIVKNISRFVDNLFLYLLVAIACFLGFKQAFTATGHYNIFGFFLLLPPLAVLLYLFMKENGKSKVGALVVFVLVAQLSATQFIRASYTGYSLKEYALFALPPKVAAEVASTNQWYKSLKVIFEKNPINYIKSLTTYDFVHNFDRTEILNERKLPSDVLEQIGSQTFDVVPWETSYAFFNQLNYQNRPIIQSYQANNEWLSNKNGEFYQSSDAPNYVLATVKSFRKQNPYWVDQGVYHSLEKNYRLIDTVYLPNDTQYLFERNFKVEPFKQELIEEGVGELNTSINVIEKYDGVYFKSDIAYSFWGKLSRLFFQPPYLWCTVNYDNGESEDFRIPPPILKAGVRVDYKVTSISDFLNIHSATGTPNDRIVSLKFWTPSPWGFNDSFDYEISIVK